MARLGVLYTIGAYLLWGMFPFYFHALAEVGAPEILAHRIWGSLLFVTFLLICVRRWAWLKETLRNPKTLLIFFCSSLLIGLNWGTYVYTIVSGRALEASLGYFVNPLISVALGAFFLKEELRVGQKLSVAIAAAGVVWITVSTGAAPYLGLFLATSFAIYGLLRKIAPLGSLEGLGLESLILTPIALSYIGWRYFQGDLALATASLETQGLIMLAGPVTTVPLLLFAAGVRMIPYSVVGIIQYLSPTIVFFIGVFWFKEPFNVNMLIGFACIWTAVIVFTLESLRHVRRRRKLQNAEAAKE